MLVNDPNTATSEVVRISTWPGSSDRPETTTMSSVGSAGVPASFSTCTLVSGTSPTFSTRYVENTAAPAATWRAWALRSSRDTCASVPPALFPLTADCTSIAGFPGSTGASPTGVTAAGAWFVNVQVTSSPGPSVTVSVFCTTVPASLPSHAAPCSTQPAGSVPSVTAYVPAASSPNDCDSPFASEKLPRLLVNPNCSADDSVVAFRIVSEAGGGTNVLVIVQLVFCPSPTTTFTQSESSTT